MQALQLCLQQSEASINGLIKHSLVCLPKSVKKQGTIGNIGAVLSLNLAFSSLGMQGSWCRWLPGRFVHEVFMDIGLLHTWNWQSIADLWQCLVPAMSCSKNISVGVLGSGLGLRLVKADSISWVLQGSKGCCLISEKDPSGHKLSPCNMREISPVLHHYLLMVKNHGRVV